MFSTRQSLYRSYLYCSGSRLDLLERACATKADAVTIDLEDSVAAFNKDKARREVVQCLSGHAATKPLFVKVNPPSSRYGYADVEALAELPIAGLRVPKVNSVEEVSRLHGIASSCGFAGCLQIMLETALGIQSVDDIARASTYTSALIVGEEDLRTDLGCERTELDYSLSRVVVAARAAELLPPIMSVWPFLADTNGLMDSAIRGKQMGFWGRLCVHPSQVEGINEVFTPTTSEVERAVDLVDTCARAADLGQPAIKDREGNYISVWAQNQAQRTLALAKCLGVSPR